jgi:hypothetical protein
MTQEELRQFKVYSPGALRELNHDDLITLLNINPGLTEQTWIRDELHRRHLGAIADETKNLIVATNVLVSETEKVHQEVAILAASSTRLETLTHKLKSLTWALILLSILAVGVPVAIEIWHISHIPEVKKVQPAHPQQAAPQTPNFPVP